MFEWLAGRILHLLRVPAVPEPPAGAPGSVRVFRAGRNYFKLRLLAWGVGQFLTLVGILFSVGFLLRIEYDLGVARAAPPASAVAPATLPSVPPRPARFDLGQHIRRFAAKPEPELTRIAAQVPPWLFPVLNVFKLLGILAYLGQIPITYAAVRLDYEQRWYLVTDRSLRIRSGLWGIQELTMSFANLQQVVVTQGPLQRLFGLADVRVQSAGGGGGGEDLHEHQDDSLHTGLFHGVDNAAEIRDLMLDRLRRFRAAGLGDPDDPRDPASATPIFISTRTTALIAVQELLTEARALRRALGESPRTG